MAHGSTTGLQIGDENCAHCRRTHAQAPKMVQADVARELGRVATGSEPVGAAVGRGQWRARQGQDLRSKRLDAQQCEPLSPACRWRALCRPASRQSFGRSSACARWWLASSASNTPTPCECCAVLLRRKSQKRATRRDGGQSVEAQDFQPALKKKRARAANHRLNRASRGCRRSASLAPGRQGAHAPSFSKASLGSRCRRWLGLSWWRFYFRFFDGAIKSEQIIKLSARSTEWAPAADHLGWRAPLSPAAGRAIGSNGDTDTSPSRRCRPTRLSSVEAIWPLSEEHGPTCA